MLVEDDAELASVVHDYLTEHGYDVSVEVYADRIAFNREVGNLLSNAFRFAHSRVLIHLSNDAEKVCIDVEDDASRGAG